MNIGRKIYYELATGNVIVDTGERAGDVVATTEDQDFTLYAALAPYQRSAVGVLQLNFGDYAQNFATYSAYHVDTSTGNIVWDGTSLSNAQNAQETQINGSFNKAISTFQSSALGGAHTYTYLADSMSMAFLNGEYAYVRSSDYKGESINWYTEESGKVSHTGAQIAQVFLDGRTWMKNQEAHKDRLIAQIQAATTATQASSYSWTTPPNVPTGLAGTAGTAQASLTWTANTESDLAGYNVYQNGTKVNTTLLTGTTDTVTGLTSGTTYNFSITAVDVNGNESAQCASVSVKAN